MLTIFRDATPVVLCAIGKGRTHEWTVLEAFRETFGTVTVVPPHVQWLATVELQSLGRLPVRQAFRLIDCERYLAAAMLSPVISTRILNGD